MTRSLSHAWSTPFLTFLLACENDDVRIYYYYCCVSSVESCVGRDAVIVCTGWTLTFQSTRPTLSHTAYPIRLHMLILQQYFISFGSCCVTFCQLNTIHVYCRSCVIRVNTCNNVFHRWHDTLVSAKIMSNLENRPYNAWRSCALYTFYHRSPKPKTNGASLPTL